MNLNTALNEAAVQALAPYIVELRTFGDGACIANLAHRFFGVRNNDGQLLVFPQLKELTTISCCFKNTYYYGVKNITVSRLPQLQILYFDDTPCGLLDRGEPSENDDVRHNWKPKYSGYPHIIVPPQRWQYLTELTIAIISSSILMDIVNFNPQLQRLAIRTEYSDIPIRSITSVYNHDQFQIDTILDRLPHLVEFTIGRLNSRLVADSATIPPKRRRDISITIERQIYSCATRNTNPCIEVTGRSAVRMALVSVSLRVKKS
ncbi:hypothetical protein GQ42DRAFT_181487 [Ramicandelaber brevisporus]|nr:hypothetical protein GQ42DRAFT_181487 [Ramicandelaber brevisporus]